MIEITKEEKSLIKFVFVLIFGAMLCSAYITDKEIKALRVEVEGLEIHKQNLEEIIQEKENQNEELESQLHEKTQESRVIEQELFQLQEENEKLRTIRAKLTAYSPLDDKDGRQSQGNPSRTSTGRRVGRNVVAVDPKKIPYGTKLEIPGYGEVVAGDTGGALRNDDKNIRIDLYKDTYSQAINFGVKDMDVKILEWGGE